MVTLKDWQYIARYMKMSGFSARAITETLDLLGHYKSIRGVRDCLNLHTFPADFLPPGYLEYAASFLSEAPPTRKEAIGLDEVVSLLLEINAKSISAGSEVERRDSPLSSAYSRELFSQDGVSRLDSDYETGGFLEVAPDDAEELSSDSFSYWSGDSYKSGLKRYLDYERRSNSSAEILEGYDA